jgi:hypothetical protein
MRATMLVILVALLCCGAFTSAQIQSDESGVLAIFPPAKEEIAKPGSEIFLLTTLQKSPDGNEFNQIPCLYEYRPGSTSLIKRAELVQSYRPASQEVSPEYLRLLMMNSSPESKFWLYWVNYQSWQIRRLFVSKTVIGGIAANEKRAYFSAENGIQAVDRQTQNVTLFPLGARLVMLLDRGVHLIRYSGEPENEAHTYDFKREVDLGKIQLPAEYSRNPRFAPKISPNLKYIAFFKGVPWEERVRNRVIKSEFIIYDLASGDVRSVPVLVYVNHRPFSEIDPYYVEMDWDFGIDSQSFRYVTARIENETAPDIKSLTGGFEEVVLDFNSGKEIRGKSRPSASSECASSCSADYYVPDFLKNEIIKNPRDVVRGLLDILKIDHNLRRDAKCMALAFSLGKKRFLGNIPMTDGSSQLIFGDLNAKTAVKVNTPADMVLEYNGIHAVTVPGAGVPMTTELNRSNCDE